jgi:hypothetical protein
MIRALLRRRRGVVALLIAATSGLFITAGVALIYLPAGLIAAGLLLVGLLFVDLEPARRV